MFTRHNVWNRSCEVGTTTDCNEVLFFPFLTHIEFGFTFFCVHASLTLVLWSRYNDEPQHVNKRIPRKNHHPGPQTYDPIAIRNAISLQSNQKNTPGIKFGTGQRDCNAEKKCETPSPAEYDPEAIRRGIMFSKCGTTFVKFGTARSNDSKPCSKPGPAVRIFVDETFPIWSTQYTLIVDYLS